MPISEQEQNKRTAASLLLDELNSPETPLDRKIEITTGAMAINPEAFIQIAKVHLRATADPKFQD